jgi:hypothetical protein
MHMLAFGFRSAHRSVDVINILKTNPNSSNKTSMTNASPPHVTSASSKTVDCYVGF